MMRNLLVLTLLLLGCAPVAAQIEVPTIEFQLPNGLNVILHEDHRVPMVSTNLWYFVGSANETPGRTGFAHLFEHLLFEGSGHVKEGEFDTLLEAAGGNNNGSTNTDRTNYYETMPSNALELALFLESDRMGYLLDSMGPDVVDSQREVVKNERRQSYENRPYGMADLRMDELLWPKGHPYSWPTIGYMEDLDAAGYDDVVNFYKRYYVPNNASLVIAGDIDPVKTRALVEKWFSDVAAGAPVARLSQSPAQLDSVKRETIRDQVQLPRLYIAWLTPPVLDPGDADLDVTASVLAGGKNSRLKRRLVYEMQAAQDVWAYQSSAELGSAFYIVATARPGHTLEELQAVIDEELARLASDPPSNDEMARAVNGIEANFLRRLEQVESKADMLNAYFKRTGQANYFNQDLARYKALKPQDVSEAVRTYLTPSRRVELSVVPEEK